MLDDGMTSVNIWVPGMGNVVFDHQPLDDLLPTMAYTCRVQLAVYDSPCPSQHLSPFENKIGGYPVSLREFGTPYSISIYVLFCLWCTGLLFQLSTEFSPYL